MKTLEVTTDADTLYGKAATFLDSGRPNVARPLLAAALALSGPSTEGTLLTARLAMSEGGFKQAMRQLDSGIARAPRSRALRKCRADLKMRIRDFDGAARDAAEAVTLDPADAQAKAIMGKALLDLGRAVDAVTCLTEAVNSATENADYHLALSGALETINATDRALLVLVDGIAQCPRSIALRNAAILLCLRRRDFPSAHRLAEEARCHGIADACTFGMRGHALSSMGRHEEAALSYQDALKLGPDDPYVRHLAMACGLISDAKRAAPDYVRAVFDGYAHRFESHLASLRYRVPDAIRIVVQSHPQLAAGLPLGPALDLGCGTGLVALSLRDLPVGPITGIDISPGMLAQADTKELYANLLEADIVAELSANEIRWPLIIAADVLCYFGDLADILRLVRPRLEPNGWFVFSVERMLPRDGAKDIDQEGWALQRQGRYAHSEQYVLQTLEATGFRVRRLDHLSLREEAGADAEGLLLTVERISHDD